MPNALIIITEGFEEMETVAPVDLLRRAGVDVTLATIDDERLLTGRSGIVLQAEASFAEVADAHYDLMVIPGGPGHTRMLDHGSLLARLRRQVREDRWLGSICAGPQVLNAAGLLEGHPFTSHHSTAEDLPARDTGTPVVQSGKLITSQGAGTATRFGLALIRAVCGEKKAREVAQSIAFE